MRTWVYFKIIITIIQRKRWHSFHRPTGGQRLSQAKKVRMQTKAVYHRWLGCVEQKTMLTESNFAQQLREMELGIRKNMKSSVFRQLMDRSE